MNDRINKFIIQVESDRAFYRTQAESDRQFLGNELIGIRTEVSRNCGISVQATGGIVKANRASNIFFKYTFIKTYPHQKK
jgi:hypothetical protein